MLTFLFFRSLLDEETFIEIDAVDAFQAAKYVFDGLRSSRIIKSSKHIDTHQVSRNLRYGFSMVIKTSLVHTVLDSGLKMYKQLF